MTIPDYERLQNMPQDFNQSGGKSDSDRNWASVRTVLSLCDNGYKLEDAEAIIAAKDQEEVFNLMQKGYGRGDWRGKFENGVCDMHGTPTSADSYPIGAQASIKAAANCGTPGIEAAVAYVQNVPTKPNTDRNMKYDFALIQEAR